MHPWARRYPGAQPNPQHLVVFLSRTMLRIDDVAKSSQLATKERGALVDATRMALHGTMMAVQEERHKEPTAPMEPKLQWVVNNFLNIIDHNTMLEYAIMARHEYFGLHHRCKSRLMGNVYLYCHHLIFMIVMYPQMNHFLTKTLLFVRPPCMSMISWRSYLAVMHLFEVPLKFCLPTLMRYVLTVILNLNF